MSGGALRFQRVEMRRMPGIPGGLPALSTLSPGINLVHGPNGSGKSSTARALAALLWPIRAPEEALLRAGFVLGGEGWEVEVDGPRATYRREGGSSPAPPLPPPELGDRYHLSLHHLLLADDARLAEAIVQEAAGGYDLAAAAADLGLRSSPAAPRRESAAVRATWAGVQRARAREAELAHEQSRLEALEEERRRILAAGERARLLDLRLRERAARAAHEEALAAVRAFPPAVARLTGDEEERLVRLRDQHASAAERIRAAAEASRSAEREVSAAGLPPGGPEDGLTRLLRGEQRRAQELEAVVLGARQRLAEAESREEGERLRIAPAGAVGTAEIDAAALGEIAELARRAEELRAERSAFLAEVRWVGRGAVEEPARLEEGARLLSRWLAEGRDAARWGGARTLAITAAVIAAIEGAALAALVHPAALLLLLSAAVLLLLAARSAPDPREGLRGEFERLGVGEPPAWREEAVELLRDELLRRTAAAKEGERRRARRAAMEEAEGDLRAREEALERRRRELVRRHGVAPELDEPRLLWLIERISSWQRASADARAASAALAVALAERDDLLRRASARIAPYGYDAAADAAELGARADSLEERERSWRAARAALSAAGETRAALAGWVRELEAEQARVYGAVGLPPGDEETLREWGRLREPLLAAEERLRTTRLEWDRARALLPDGAADAGTGADEPRAGEAGEEGAERDRLLALAERLPAVERERVEIETRLRAAREGCEMEAALAAHSDALAALAAARDRSAAALVGGLLVDHLRRTGAERERPLVLRRAAELLATMTAGRHGLELGAGSTPAFRAVDAVTEEPRALEELSSATRVQLLLAVRLAFVEVQEAGVRLPLVLDETLGNSDDERAAAVVEALIGAARLGRQLFYFTARPEEVERWRAALALHPDVPCAVHRLPHPATAGGPWAP